VIDGPPTEALRLQSADLLRDGLLRLLVNGEEQWLKDRRDLLVAMAPYHDCATRLGLDPARFFDEVSRESPHTLAGTVRTFGQRTDITPSAFGFHGDDLARGTGLHVARRRLQRHQRPGGVARRTEWRVNDYDLPSAYDTSDRRVRERFTGPADQLLQFLQWQ
jgi:hypothetical protein